MRTTLTFLFLNLFISLHAQYGSKIRSDVPGATLSALTLEKQMIQLQHNYAFLDFKHRSNMHLFSNYLRYGITDKLEIDIGVDYGLFRKSTDFAGMVQTRMAGEVVGFNIGPRYNLLNENDHDFNWTIIGTVALKKVYENSSLPDFNLGTSLSYPFNKGEFGLSAGVYIVSDYSDIYSATLKYTHFFHPDFLMFLEDAVSFDSMSLLNHINTGFGYFINPDLMVHLAGGYGLFKNRTLENSTLEENNLFFETGVSWRIAFNK